MAAFPRRIRRGSGGDVYYFDGVHAGTILPAVVTPDEWADIFASPGGGIEPVPTTTP